MSAQENAEAFLIVVKRLAKWALFGLLALISIGLLIGGVAWLYEYWTHDRPKSQVKIEVIFPADELCKGEYPVFVGVVNNSNKTIKSYSFYIDAREPGRSTDIADYGALSDDKIIKSGGTHGSCWRVAKRKTDYSKPAEWIVNRNIEISISSYNVSFE